MLINLLWVQNASSRNPVVFKESLQLEQGISLRYTLNDIAMIAISIIVEACGIHVVNTDWHSTITTNACHHYGQPNHCCNAIYLVPIMMSSWGITVVEWELRYNG